MPEQAFQRRGLHPQIEYKVYDDYSILAMIRQGLGVSILPQSACAREQKKGKMAVLPIENLSMMRETKIVYKKDFIHMDILQEITRVYHETARSYQ